MILTEQEIEQCWSKNSRADDYEKYSLREHVLRAARAIESAVLAKLTAQEPFGYFKADAFCWTDCAETDDGAKPLYEHPLPPDDVVRDAARYRWLRGNPDWDCGIVALYYDDYEVAQGDKLDAAIDAAMEKP